MSSRRRQFRVAERVQMVVANELLRMADPRFSLVTITYANVSPDLRNAKVFWMIHGDELRVLEAEEAFEGAAGHFRRLIGTELGLRFTPEVKFYYDESLDEAQRVEELLASVRSSGRDGAK